MCRDLRAEIYYFLLWYPFPFFFIKSPSLVLFLKHYPASFAFFSVSASVQHNRTKILTWQAPWRRQSNVCRDEYHKSLRLRMLLTLPRSITSLFISAHVCKRFRLFDLEVHDPDVHFFLIPEIPFNHARTILKSLILLAEGKSRKVVSQRGIIRRMLNPCM